MARIVPFGEGQTEKIVFEFVSKQQFPNISFENFVDVGGTRNFATKIKNIIESDLTSGKEIRVIVFRDLDGNETVKSVVQSFDEIVQRLIGHRLSFIQVPPYSIYKWDTQAQPSPSSYSLRFVLHIAQSPPNFPIRVANQTADNYILAVGLQKAVLDRFASASKVNSNAHTLYQLIINDIPTIIRQSNIIFDEGKDYLAAYLIASRFWVVHRTEDQTRLMRIILNRSSKSNVLNNIFESWIRAIKEIVP